MNEDIEKLKTIVESILRTNKKARNDDKFLIYLVVREFTNLKISFDEFSKAPSFESITRIRRKLQNDNGQYRADRLIEQARQNKEAHMREKFR